MNHLSSGQQKILVVLALLLLTLLYFKFYYSRPALPEKTTEEIVVEVVGEVGKPGVYIFQHAPSLKEAIEKAGGLRESGAAEKDSLSESLRTGTLLNIRKESHQGVRINIERMEANKLLVFNIPLDLNRVSVEELCLIPGIGEALAKEVVMYRERRKRFQSVEELKKIKGIGNNKYPSLKNFFTVEN